MKRRPKFRARIVERRDPLPSAALDAWVRRYVALILDLEGYPAPRRQAEAS